MFSRLIMMSVFAIGGYLLWNNRFAIQRQLESAGIKTPLLKGSVTDAARSVVAQGTGKMDHGVNLAERELNRDSSVAQTGFNKKSAVV